MNHVGANFDSPALSSDQVALRGYTGGTDGKVVRHSTGTTFADAANTDTPAQLLTVMFKQAGLLLTTGSVVTGLTGLVAGSLYFLSTAGDITSTAPTPSATVASQRIGVALSTTSLLFRPGDPIRGA